jgi:KaiC/GvpD/RAD55 family RecA-like ATPase
MIDSIFYFAFLAIIGALILFLLKQKGSYFKSAQIVFIIAFASFAIVIFCDFVKNHIIQEGWEVYYTTSVGITAVLVAAIAVEHAAIVLYRKRHCTSSKKEWSTLKAVSLLFKSYAVVVLIVSWALGPWSVTFVTTLWGGIVYTPIYDAWFTYLLGGFLAFVMAYPCGLLMLSSVRCKEKLVSDALAWLGASWAATGFSLMFFNGYVRYLGYEMIEIGYTLNMVFFTIIAYYFTKTTILEEFFETPLQVLRVKEGEHVVVFYTSHIDKMKIFANYISEGLQRGERVVYAFPDEESTIVRLELKGLGIDAEKHEKEGSLVLMGLSEAYLSNGHFTKERSIEFWKKFKEESKSRGFKNERDLFDLGNMSFLRGEEDEYLNYLKEADAQIMDAYLTELRAINVEKLDRKLVEEFKFLTTESLDLLEQVDRFSQQLGLTHQELAGRIFLLEINPASKYENLIQNLALEAAANIEPITVFTTRGSAVHSILSKRENARFFLLTQLESSPQPNSTKEDIFLPAKNTSLLLDAVNKTLRSNAYSNQNIIFDNLSALLLSVGFEKTYSFVQYALELLSSRKTTALFLLSSSAHDEKIASGLRSLFNDQISYMENGLEIVKLHEPKSVRVDVAIMREVENEERK